MRNTTTALPFIMLLYLAACADAGAGGGGRQDAVAGNTDAASGTRARASAGTGERPVSRTLASGTTIHLRANDSLNSRRNHVGDTVIATTTRAAVSPDNVVVIPVGTAFRGRIIAIAPAERPGLDGTLQVEFTAAQVGGAWRPVLVRVDSLATVMAGRGVTGGDVVKVGAGTVAGGVAGRVIGGNRTGTAIGAAAGTVAGVVYANQTRDIDIVLPAAGAIRIALMQPFSVVPSPGPGR